MRIVTVVQGGHGPVPMVENTRRYIDADPVDVDADNAYYARRMMSGELIEVALVQHVEAKSKQVGAPMPFPPAEKKEEER